MMAAMNSPSRVIAFVTDFICSTKVLFSLIT
jgi:hypothetical protein